VQIAGGQPVWAHQATGRTSLPERSKLFKSHWSNQWLISKIQLWVMIPEAYRQQATFYTDHDVVYKGVIPAAQHYPRGKLSRKTNHIERFNNTLRQRVSRLVRRALSFSKKRDNHIGAIKYFIYHYNLTKVAIYCQHDIAITTVQQAKDDSLRYSRPSPVSCGG
jgi:hypothetical protein